MRHLKSGRKFSRLRAQRKALFRILLGELVRHGRIFTSEAKAKEIAPMAEKMVTLAKRGTTSAGRLLESRLPYAAAQKLIKDIVPRFGERHGGYTRIVKLEPRKSDSSRRALIEFVE